MLASEAFSRGTVTRDQEISDPTVFAPWASSPTEGPAEDSTSLHAASRPSFSTNSSSTPSLFAYTSTSWPRKSSLSLLAPLPPSLSPPPRETSICVECSLHSIISSTLPQPTSLHSLSPSSALLSPSNLPFTSSSSSSSSSSSFSSSSFSASSSSSFSISSSSLSSFTHSSPFSSSNTIPQFFSSPSSSPPSSSSLTPPVSPAPLPYSSTPDSSSSSIFSSYAPDSSIAETSATGYLHDSASRQTPPRPHLDSNLVRSSSPTSSSSSSSSSSFSPFSSFSPSASSSSFSSSLSPSSSLSSSSSSSSSFSPFSSVSSSSSSSSSAFSTSAMLPSTLTPEMVKATSLSESSHALSDLSPIASAQTVHSGLGFSGPTNTTLHSDLAQTTYSYTGPLPLQTSESTSGVTSPSTTTSSFTLFNSVFPLDPQFHTPEGPDLLLAPDIPPNDLVFESSSPNASSNSTDLLLGGSASTSHSLDVDYLDYNYTLGMCYGSPNSSAMNSTSGTASSDDYNYDYCDSYYIFFWEELGPLLVVYGLTFLVGVVGNLLIIVVVRRNPRLHNATNMFLTSLATADLLFLLLSVPVKVAKLFSYSWSFGPVLCKLVHYVQNILVICSVLTLAAISVERYYGIVHPMKAVYKCTMSQARKVIALVWLASFFLASPILVVQMHLEVGEAVRAYWCVRSWDWVWAWRLHETYLLLLVVCAPSVLMGAAYYKVCREVVKTYAVHQLEAGLWRKDQVEVRRSIDDVQAATNTGRSRRDAATRTQVVRMLIVVVLMFVACWSPVMLIHVLQAWDFLPLYSTAVKHLKTFADFLSYANSCINPLVYGFMSRNFRDAFRCAMCGRRRRRKQSLPQQWRWADSCRTKTNDGEEARMASSVLRKDGKTRRGGRPRSLTAHTSRFSFKSSSWFSTAASSSASPDKSFENDSIRDSTYGDTLSFECPSVTKIGNIRLEFPSDCTVTLTVTQPDKRHRHENCTDRQCHPQCLQNLDTCQFPQLSRHRQYCPNRESHLGAPRHHRHHFSRSLEVLKASSEYN